MRKSYFLLCFLLLGLKWAGHAGTATASGYELRFKITGLKDSMIYLANYYGDKQYLKDSALADKQGNVLFKRAEPLPGGIYLFVFPNKTYFEILIDKEQHFSAEAEMEDVVSTIRFKGSEDNRLFYEYMKFIQAQSKAVEPLRAQRKALADEGKPTAEVDEKIRKIDQQVADYKDKYVSEHPATMLASVFSASKEPEVPELPLKPDGSRDSSFAYRYFKAHYFDGFDMADERLLRSPIYHNKLSFYVKNMVLQIPDSIIPECDMLIQRTLANKETFKYVVWYLTNTYETSNIMGMDAVFVHLVKNYYTKEKAYWADETTLYKIQERARILDPILVGKKVKNLILSDSTNAYQSLYSISKPYTILYFWDPDCGHCKKATPKVKAYYDKVKDKGVEVFAVCTEVEIDKWKKFIIDHQLNWINVADPKLQNNFRQDFDINTTPQIFLLDKDKKILAKKIDEYTLEKILNKELGLPPPPEQEKEKKEEKSGH